MTGEINNWEEFYELFNIEQSGDTNFDVELTRSQVAKASQIYSKSTKQQYIVKDDDDGHEENKENKVIVLHHVTTGEDIRVSIEEI